MITQDDKLKIVDTIINISIISKQHPYLALRTMVKAYDMRELQAKKPYYRV